MKRSIARRVFAAENLKLKYFKNYAIAVAIALLIAVAAITASYFQKNLPPQTPPSDRDELTQTYLNFVEEYENARQEGHVFTKYESDLYQTYRFYLSTDTVEYDYLSPTTKDSSDPAFRTFFAFTALPDVGLALILFSLCVGAGVFLSDYGNGNAKRLAIAEIPRGSLMRAKLCYAFVPISAASLICFGFLACFCAGNLLILTDGTRAIPAIGVLCARAAGWYALCLTIIALIALCVSIAQSPVPAAVLPIACAVVAALLLVLYSDQLTWAQSGAFGANAVWIPFFGMILQPVYINDIYYGALALCFAETAVFSALACLISAKTDVRG